MRLYLQVRGKNNIKKNLYNITKNVGSEVFFTNGIFEYPIARLLLNLVVLNDFVSHKKKFLNFDLFHTCFK